MSDFSVLSMIVLMGESAIRSLYEQKTIIFMLSLKSNARI